MCEFNRENGVYLEYIDSLMGECELYTSPSHLGFVEMIKRKPYTSAKVKRNL